MFMKFFGSTSDEQLRGISTFVIFMSLVVIVLVIVVVPVVGDKTSETKVSVEIVKVFVGLISTAFGFLLGNMKSDKKSSDE